MRLYCIVFIITTIEAKSVRKYCDIVSSDPTRACFVKETLTSVPHSPNQLAVDRATNTLYFSFDFGQGEYVPALLNIESKSLNVLKGVKDAFAIANDNSTGDMYFGGSHGIYKYNAKKKLLQRLNINNLDIWWLFVKTRLYFIKFPSLGAFYYLNKNVKPMPELKNNIIHQFVMDKDDNIFFINSTGLFGIKNDENEPILMRDNPKFVGITTDINGFVHVCSDDGVFVVTNVIQKVKKVISVQGVLGITFDSFNNLIYSNSHDIVRLIPVYNGYYTEKFD